MEVDHPAEHHGDADSALQDLSEIMVELQDRPHDVELRRRQIAILETLPMVDELIEAVNALAEVVMLSVDEWKQCLDKVSTSSPSLETFLQTMECFATAERDYLSADILERHVLYLVASERTAASNSDQDLTSFLSEDRMRMMLQDVCAQADGLLSNSSRIWNVYREWEQDRATLLPGEDKPAQLARIHEVYLARLAVPHLDLDTTSSDYSSFCTEYCPAEYEKRMVEATAIVQKARAKLSVERRHGATREDYELQLVAAQNAGDQLPLFMSYIAWETDPKAKKAGSKSGPVIDNALTATVFERALAVYANLAHSTPDTQLRKSLKTGEASIWNRYAIWARDAETPDVALAVSRRAVRACPGESTVWCSYLLMMELSASTSTEIDQVFERAFALGYLTTGESTDFMDVVVTRASMQVRRPAPQSQRDVISTATQGFALLAQVNKAGDASLRLEKFLLEWAESQDPEILQQALVMVEQPLRSRTTSYQMAILKAHTEARRGAVDAARHIYEAAVRRSDLDWPEAVYEAFLRFEQVHGDAETIDRSQQLIEKESVKLARRREKAAYAQAQVQATPQAIAATTAVADAEPTSDQQPVSQQTGGTMESNPKRDREHTTVLVGGLAKFSKQELIESFFESCGSIREVTILSDDAWSFNSALLEFKSADAVPAALGKDRRRLDNQEISVTMLWRSTLFVTNFPRETDDAVIRSLFTHYGTILQTRWPSRKYADNRRFCYITMDSPASAESARVLDGFKPNGEGQFGMKVLISDPAVKAKRSDADDAVLFVGGLNAKSTEQEVFDLFKGHGSVQGVKLGWDPVKGICKGFAFVTMSTEDDAKKALGLHGLSHKGRFLKVEVNDRNHANKKTVNDAAHKDKRARTVRLGNLPEGTQEALLQQSLEKLVSVRRLEIFVKSRHALAELDTAADVGKLLLRSEPFVFEGATIEISEHDRRAEGPRKPGPPDASSEATPPPASSLSFAPRAAKRGGKVLGRGRPRPANTTVSKPAVESSNPQDAFRAIVDSKNKQREANLETSRAKRRHEDQGPSESDDAKKYKPS